MAKEWKTFTESKDVVQMKKVLCAETKVDVDEDCGHQCPEGYCIPSVLKCDGFSHCTDSSDEDGCPGT